MNDALKNNNVTASEEVNTDSHAAMAGKYLADAVSMASSLRSAATIQAAKAMSKKTCAFAKTALGHSVKKVVELGAQFEVAKAGCNFITSLAQRIDAWLLEREPAVEEYAEDVVEEAVEEVVEEVVEETVEPAPVEEPALEAFAVVENAGDSDDDDEDEDDRLPEGLASMKLDYIDVMENPEAYAEMLEQEARGEVTLVTRYRRSFMSRLVQSQGNVQDYYNEIKNLLLSYKGVKGRVSWGNESFNRGRAYLAKVNAKTKTLYIYLAIDPKTLEDGKYEIVDVSDKKKYANVPTLIKVKGDRKFKYAIELLTKLCAEDMALPLAKNFEPQDYRTPYVDTEALVLEGTVKKMVAAVPVSEIAE